MNEEVSVTLNLEDWMTVTGALSFLEKFDGQEKFKNLADRINHRIIYALKENAKKE